MSNYANVNFCFYFQFNNKMIQNSDGYKSYFGLFKKTDLCAFIQQQVN